MTDITEIFNELNEKCNFSESSLDQLRNELPKYLNKKASLDKLTLSLAQTLRNIATTESNEKMQDCMFICASTYEAIDKELKIYKDCSDKTNIILGETKLMLISPLRVNIYYKF